MALLELILMKAVGTAFDSPQASIVQQGSRLNAHFEAIARQRDYIFGQFGLIIAFCAITWLAACIRAIALVLEAARLPYGREWSQAGIICAFLQFPTTLLGCVAVYVASSETDIKVIGGCITRTTKVNGMFWSEPIYGLCTEWKLSLAFTVLTLVSLLSTYLSYLLRYHEAFFDWVGQKDYPYGMTALPRPPCTPPPPWTPSESLIPLLRQDKPGSPSELEASYDTPDDGPNSVESYGHKADDLEQAVKEAETDAGGYTARYR
ncbi:hypothetical protein FS837_000442 [Tulasnella sp. UAMH 9824]|nr:hypothetical protein FS837_000442 [Tulasnella sp. UAMH 9824]